MSDYTCHKCQTFHTTGNMVAYCAACYASADSEREAHRLTRAERDVNRRQLAEAESAWRVERDALKATLVSGDALVFITRAQMNELMNQLQGAAQDWETLNDASHRDFNEWCAELNALKAELAPFIGSAAYACGHLVGKRESGHSFGCPICAEIHNAYARAERAEAAFADKDLTLGQTIARAEKAEAELASRDEEGIRKAFEHWKIIELTRDLKALEGELAGEVELVKLLSHYLHNAQPLPVLSDTVRALATAESALREKEEQVKAMREKVLHALKDTCNCDPSIDDAPLCVSCEALGALTAKPQAKEKP